MSGPDEDTARIVGLLASLGAAEVVHTFILPGSPASKARPRSTFSGHVYVKKEDREAEEQTGRLMRELVAEPMTGNVALACIFYRPNRLKIDVDNMLKHVCDAANRVLWLDDSQCTSVTGVVELDRENPRTVIGLAHHQSTMTRGSDTMHPCPTCASPVSEVGGKGKRRFCSNRCAALARHGVSLERPVPCTECGTLFKRAYSTQRYCGNDCRINARVGVPTTGRTYSNCATCGVQLTHRRGGRCRECWRKNPLNK